MLDWYEDWSKGYRAPDAPINWEDDPLIRLIGSGKHIWADEHADEYVENLRQGGHLSKVFFDTNVFIYMFEGLEPNRSTDA